MNNNIQINIQGTKNNSISLSLEKLSHTIIFGAAGSGKSNLLHMLITNLVNTYSPEELNLALIDPKCVEFRMYNKLPHLFPYNIFTSPTDIMHYFENLIDERLNTKNSTPLVIIIDELVELSYNKNIKSSILSVLDKGAKNNIYLIMATQRPAFISEEIINKTSTQICFPIDSDRLPKKLANKLKTTQIKNHGEMIFSNGETTEYMQTAYITPTTINDTASKFKNK